MTLAPGILLVPGSSGSTVFFRCDRFRPFEAYAAMTASAGPAPSASISGATRSVYASIALKLAAAEAPGLHCNNAPAFPASVPALPPVRTS